MSRQEERLFTIFPKELHSSLKNRIYKTKINLSHRQFEPSEYEILRKLHENRITLETAAKALVSRTPEGILHVMKLNPNWHEQIY